MQMFSCSRKFIAAQLIDETVVATNFGHRPAIAAQNRRGNVPIRFWPAWSRYLVARAHTMPTCSPIRVQRVCRCIVEMCRAPKPSVVATNNDIRAGRAYKKRPSSGPLFHTIELKVLTFLGYR